MSSNKIITILVDNDSWIISHAEKLKQNLNQLGYNTLLARTVEDIQEGWICFLLGCIHLVPNNYLRRNKHNLVVHESDLPKGRGFAPMAWQILEGENEISICLLDAAEEADAGDIWIKDTLSLSGTELCREWRNLQGLKTIELCEKFVKNYSELTPRSQEGSSTNYPRRTPKDSQLDINKSIKENFNLLRIVDNERYPAFFELNGVKFKLKIEKYER